MMSGRSSVITGFSNKLSAFARDSFRARPPPRSPKAATKIADRSNRDLLPPALKKSAENQHSANEQLACQNHPNGGEAHSQP